MTPIEYFKQCLNTDYIYKLEWYFAIFLIYTKDNKYVNVKNGKYFVWLNNGWEELNHKVSKEYPILTFGQEIILNKGQLENVRSDITTKVGRVVANAILLVRNFGDKIEFINDKFDAKTVEKKIAPLLRNSTILVNEYLRFTDAVSFIELLSPITNISATYKNILPPPNLDKIKKELEKEYEKKYGPGWIKDRLRLVEFQEDLKKVDEEWLKDDPTMGKLVSGKIKDNARVRMYLTFGPEVGFHKDGSKTTFVKNSLADQAPVGEREQLAAMFNSARSASYDRGKETQKGGSATKDILRSLSNYLIEPGDCGSKEGRILTVTDENQAKLMSRFMISNGKTVEITNPKALVGKTIVLRSPMYCKYPNGDYCVTCCGKALENSRNAIPTMGAAISGKIMYVSMKSMHNTQVKLKKVDIKNMIK